ncbi:MAG: hypothetical protein WAV32_03790 [Halobacteriota archaeon]
MNPISENQKSDIIALIREGKLSREQIAAKVGVSPGTVSAIKAHLTMGTYAEPSEAEDKQGAVVVIELKAGAATPDCIAQILSYMGALSDMEQKPVRGILVAGDFPSRVVFAARAVSNLQLKKYTFRFSFEAVK